jgi:hypothetical protein
MSEDENYEKFLDSESCISEEDEFFEDNPNEFSHISKLKSRN